MTFNPWFTAPIAVAFDTGDVQYGGAHDMTLLETPNTPITALLSGHVSSITSPIWGVQVGVLLDVPFNNAPYMSYLHLAAANPALQVRSQVLTGDVIGWSGGCTDASQYVGTSNPTGNNFLDDPSQSSQPQVGIALMRGPEYGVDAGWTTLPDPALNPSVLYWRAVAAYDTWQSGVSSDFTSGIAQDWFRQYLYGRLMPPASGYESDGVNWNGADIRVREFGPLRAEWINGHTNWLRY